MNDKQIINQLNQQHGWNLKQVDSIESSGYFLNDNGFVTGLNLSNIHLKDIIFLSNLDNLTHLILNQIFIRDITPLKNQKNLIWLGLNDNKIDNIEVLKELTNLKRLELYNNRITDIKPIANLVDIELLVLAINRIEDITPLSKLTKLQHLKIYDNLITDLKPLMDLKNLTMLGINKNSISDISPLAKLHNLDTIVILDNQISDISPLKNLNKLKRLDLQSNKITELPAWITNFNMEIGLNSSNGELDLNYNPITIPPIDIVEQGKEAIKYYFESTGVEIPEESKEISNNETTTDTILGNKSRIAREATEKVINVETYAKVLAKLFKNATGEFNFGLFGAWGRGKTFLINKVKDFLIEDNYEVVIFDAWKYKRQPQVWAHLYESCVKQFIDSPKLEWAFFNNLVLKLRYGINKIGYSKIFTALIVLIAGFSSHYIFKNIPAIINAMGGLVATIVSGYLIYKVGNSINAFKKKIKDEYLIISSHKQELGLQDIIEKDLKYLLTALAKRDKHILKKYLTLLLSILVAVSIYFFIDSISGKHITGNISLPEVVGWLKSGLIIITAICLGFFNLIVWWKPGKKTCLVIDNLDRCKPDEMLEVIESIRLLLEDDELVDVLQTVMLIDEDKLRHAIAEKFSGQIVVSKNENKENEINLQKMTIEKYNLLVDEQINKLFISYLRLSNLTKNETLEITTSVLREYSFLEKSNNIRDETNSKNNKDQQEIDINYDDKDTYSPSPDNNESQITDTDTGEENIDSSDNNESVDKYFVPEEEKQIIEAIQKIYDTNPIIVNPRFIRSFTFKYFLARDLLHELNLNAANCIRLLEKAVREKHENRNNIENNTPEITDAELIIKQVV